MQSLPAGAEDHLKLCLQMCQKDISLLTTQIMGELSALPGADTTLLTKVTVIQVGLSELKFEAGGRHNVLENLLWNV